MRAYVTPLIAQDSYEFHDKNDINSANFFEPEDEGATLLTVGQRCTVFKPAQGVDWWPACVLAVHTDDDDDDSGANATYTVEFLSGYHLGDVETDVQRSDIDSTRPFRHWAGEWRREMGERLFLGHDQADTRYGESPVNIEENNTAQQTENEKDGDPNAANSTNNWHTRWRAQIGQRLYGL